MCIPLYSPPFRQMIGSQPRIPRASPFRQMIVTVNFIFAALDDRFVFAEFILYRRPGRRIYRPDNRRFSSGAITGAVVGQNISAAIADNINNIVSRIVVVQIIIIDRRRNYRCCLRISRRFCRSALSGRCRAVFFFFEQSFIVD